MPHIEEKKNCCTFVRSTRQRYSAQAQRYYLSPHLQSNPKLQIALSYPGLPSWGELRDKLNNNLIYDMHAAACILTGWASFFHC